MTNKQIASRWIAGMLLVWALGSAQAQAQDAPAPQPVCSLCGTSHPGLHYYLSSPVHRDKLLVCEPCTQLPLRCSTCNLPIPKDASMLSDGRLLCPSDVKKAIFEQIDAERIFEEVKRELAPLYAGLGKVPDRRITFRLVNKHELDELFEGESQGHQKGSLMGLTRTQSSEGKPPRHTVYLLAALGKPRLMAIAAHEYTHAWINENVPKNRVLDPAAIEAFCELVAYKVMKSLNEDVEQRVILENEYTQGKIAAFVAADEALAFHSVAAWMKSGVDRTLNVDQHERILALRQTPAPTLDWRANAATPVPDTLRLRGLSGTENRRFALVNNATVQKGDQISVRVGATNVLVRCMDVTSTSVVLEVEGEKQPLTLSLDPQANR